MASDDDNSDDDSDDLYLAKLDDSDDILDKSYNLRSLSSPSDLKEGNVIRDERQTIKR